MHDRVRVRAAQDVLADPDHRAGVGDAAVEHLDIGLVGRAHRSPSVITTPGMVPTAPDRAITRASDASR